MAYLCAPCEKTFKSNKYLQQHFKSSRHTERINNPITVIPKYKCDICGKKYIIRQSFQAHKKSKSCVAAVVQPAVTENKEELKNTILHELKNSILHELKNTILHELKNTILKEMREKNKVYKLEHKIMKAEIAVLTAALNKHEPEITNETTTTKRKKISKGVRQRIADNQQNKCGECEQILTPFFHLDHIVGLQFDGTDEESNLMALCYECHTKKTICENQSRQQIREAIQNILRENQKRNF
jgi:hypothetical protein